MSDSINKEYLKLAQITYGGDLYFGLKNFRLKEVFLPGAKIEKIYDEILCPDGNGDFYSYKNEDSGFSANLFENVVTGDIVIAYRGTERTGLGENDNDFLEWAKDIKTDINLITCVADVQFDDAYTFYNFVVMQNPGKKVTIMGHSLGGALAQIVSAKAYTEALRNKKTINLETYTYNAPGCAHLLKLLGCEENADYSFIKNYAVMNDWCGMFGEKIGESYLISPLELPETETNLPAEVLNAVLLPTHEGIFDYDEEKNGKIIKKPSDFNTAEGLSLWYFDKNNPIKETEKVKDFIDSHTPDFQIPDIKMQKKSVKSALKKFADEHPSLINDEAADKLKDILRPVKRKAKEFIKEQKQNIAEIKENAKSFVKEQKEKLSDSQIEKLKEVSEKIKDTSDKISDFHSDLKDKFIENMRNNILSSLNELLENTMKDVSKESYNKALAVLKREENNLTCAKYIEASSVKTV